MFNFRTSSLNEFRYNLPYNEMVGGGLAISRSHFLRVNGFSNQFYGWGGEDDDMSNRISKVGMSVNRPVSKHCKAVEGEKVKEKREKRSKQKKKKKERDKKEKNMRNL